MGKCLMSTIELKEKIRAMSSTERREVLALLNELEEHGDGETAEPVPAQPLMTFEEAKAFLFSNCDSLLHRLAQ